MSEPFLEPEVLGFTLAWAEHQAADGVRKGRELTEAEQATARQVGVAHPERIRVVVGALPLPQDVALRLAAASLGLGTHGEGFTLGYALFVTHPFQGPADGLLAHECRHVAQFESVGSMRDFIQTYLRQIEAAGHADAPWEREARAWQERVAPTLPPAGGPGPG